MVANTSKEKKARSKLEKRAPSTEGHRKGQSKRPKGGITISLKTISVFLTAAYELLRIIERNQPLALEIMREPGAALPRLEAILTQMDQGTSEQLRVETKSSAEVAIKVTSRLFVFDAWLKDLTPSTAISIVYLCIRGLFFKDRNPKPKENDLIFEWVFSLVHYFPIVRDRMEFLSKRGEAYLKRWKSEQRDLAIKAFRKVKAGEMRAKRIEEDIHTYLSQLIGENDLPSDKALSRSKS
jgi:hypothetical protein